MDWVSDIYYLKYILSKEPETIDEWAVSFIMKHRNETFHVACREETIYCYIYFDIFFWSYLTANHQFFFS